MEREAQKAVEKLGFPAGAWTLASVGRYGRGVTSLMVRTSWQGSLCRAQRVPVWAATNAWLGVGQEPPPSGARGP